MKSSMAIALLALVCATTPPAAASTVTRSYVGNITGAIGTRADAFPVGAAVQLSYTLETTVADFDSEPNQGLYFDSMPVLAVELPDNDFGLVTEGSVYAFNNFDNGSDPFSDMVLLFADSPVEADPVQGSPVTYAQVDFFDYEYGDATPDMLENEAIPTAALRPDVVYLYIYAGSDPDLTRFSISLLPSGTTVPELVAEAKQRVGDLVDRDELAVGVGKSLVAKLDAMLAAFDAGRNGACGPFTGLQHQVGSMSRASTDKAGAAVVLNQVIAALRTALGGC